MKPSLFFSLVRFHAQRQWQMQPIAFATLGVSALLIVGAMAVYARAWSEEEMAASEWQSFGEAAARAGRVEWAASKLQPELPAFRSKHLVEALDRAAQETKLSLDEIQFALEDSGNQPYLRYRATLTVSSGYPTIRRFLDRLQAEVAGLSIDTISCTRADIGAAELTCDLAVSAFYQRNERG